MVDFGVKHMTIDEHLYTGHMPEKTVTRLVKRIKKQKPCSGVYVVTLPLFEDGLLEVYDTNEFLQPYYKKREADIYIVGISLTKKGAFFLVRDIIDDVYRLTGSFDCNAYFKYVQ